MEKNYFAFINDHWWSGLSIRNFGKLSGGEIFDDGMNWHLPDDETPDKPEQSLLKKRSLASISAQVNYLFFSQLGFGAGWLAVFFFVLEVVN